MEDFEERLGAWSAHGNCDAATTRALAFEGEQSAVATRRTAPWHGLAIDVTDLIVPGGAFAIESHVRLGGAPLAQDDATTPSRPRPRARHEVKITAKASRDGEPRYFPLVARDVGRDAWTVVRGEFRMREGAAFDPPLTLYWEGPPAGVDLYLDAVRIAPLALDGDWRAAADARIERLRQRDARLALVGPDGAPLAHARARVELVRHAFPFGSAIAARALDRLPGYDELFLQLFNFATTENAPKWRQMEITRGRPDYTRLDRLVAFARAHDLPLRGHNIFWEGERFTPEWVRPLEGDELRAALDARFATLFPRYRGACVHWDVNNEMVLGRTFADRLGDDVRVWMFRRAHELDPDAQLFVNEFSLLANAGRRIDQALDLVADLRAAGAPVHGLGVQAHMDHVEPALMLRRLDRLAAAGLPIWITEFSLDVADEAERARQLDDFYRAAFSHPAVEGIVMWGFMAGAHFRGENALLVRRDGSFTAAGEAYRRLVFDEWTTRLELETDAAGVARYRGFPGTYRATRLDAPTPADDWQTTFTLPTEAMNAPAKIVLEWPAASASSR